MQQPALAFNTRLSIRTSVWILYQLWLWQHSATNNGSMHFCTTKCTAHTHSRNAKCKIRHDFIFSKFNKSKVNLFIKHFQLINQQHSVLNSPRRDDDDDDVEKKRKCYNAKMHRQLLYEFENEKKKNVKWTAERKKMWKMQKSKQTKWTFWLGCSASAVLVCMCM